MRLRWDDRAKANFRDVIAYIAGRNPAAAERLEEAVARTLDFVTINPLMYRPGRVAGTREAVITPNYIVIYRIDDDFITIVRILHARQNYP